MSRMRSANALGQEGATSEHGAAAAKSGLPASSPLWQQLICTAIMRSITWQTMT